MEFRHHNDRHWRHMACIPFIYAVMIPAVLLDITVEVYHRVCFPLFGLPCLVRSQYIRMDRHRLSYLTWYEKINCMYCGYMNGLFYYVSAIAGATEQYWCGIKHEQIAALKEQPHHKDFLPYGNEQAFQERVAS